MLRRDFHLADFVSGRRVFTLLAISLLATGGLLAGTLVDASGTWNVVAVQNSSPPNGLAPAGGSMALCTFQGSMTITQTGRVISGSIGLTETGASMANGFCAESIGTTLNGTVMGNDVWFLVLPGFSGTNDFRSFFGDHRPRPHLSHHAWT